MIQSAGAGLLAGHADLAFAQSTAQSTSIFMPVSTPVYLRALLDILAYPMVPPESEPDAQMFIDLRKRKDAVAQLGRLLGMLAETGYLDSKPISLGGAVTLAARFLYYHELGHLMAEHIDGSEHPSWMVPEEDDIIDELVADQYAFSLLMLELRSHPEMQVLASWAMVLAMALFAALEFAEAEQQFDAEHQTITRSVREAVWRKSRLFHWANVAVRQSDMTSEALQNAEFAWGLFDGLLREVDQVPSPVRSLLTEISQREAQQWEIATNYLLTWCTFGARRTVLSAVRTVRDDARNDQSVIADAVLRLIDFVLDDTRHLEPTLGLRDALER
ncbi:MAG TPA: hypothetical protein VIW69_10220 [Candidatus Elarobacter sp.]